MHRFHRKIQLIFFLFFFIQITPVHADYLQKIYSQGSGKPLQVILDDAEFALTERNFRITGRLHVGNAIRERGRTDFPSYEIILYCSISFAEKILEHSPQSIDACPGRLTVRSNDNGYIISATLWPDETDKTEIKEYINQINRLIVEIVDFAAQDWLFINEK